MTDIISLIYSAGSVLLSIFTFLIIFGILIILHEFGHFWAARAAKVKILEFGFGMPPKIWGKKTSRNTEDGTEEMEWTLNAIPFGGFVRMEGEDGTSNHPRAFNNRPLLWRMLVISGGVIMNFLLGWGLLTASFMIGVQMPETGVGSIHVGKLVDDMPAIASELKEKDILLEIDNIEITSYENFLSTLKNDAEKKQIAHFTILRKNEKIEIEIMPNENGIFGIVPQFTIKTEKYEFINAGKRGFEESFIVMKGSIDALGNLVTNLTTKHKIPEGIGGPVAIASTTDAILEHGTFLQLVLFTAMLSLSLAVLNIMPFPGLDGGRFIFLLIEAIFVIFTFIATKIFHINYNFPKRLPHSLEMYINAIGMLTLFSFLIWVTFLDIGKLFG
ncbi:TPA: site-2 protease family protein [Candidatus Gracilibacteria bacterium]|nr:site-2 protease family protein [Candidatus Gracilibacteria bacterium]HIQ57362.1 site-2 protease family protein [Candidatus Gracilibacteria bacterium]